MTHLPDPVLLPDGLQTPHDDPTPRRARARWRVLVGVLVALVGGGVLVGGAVAIIARIGVDGAGTPVDGAQSSTQPQAGSTGVSGPVADFESFALGLDGVSDGDAAVVVELAAVADGEAPRGTADVLVDADGERRLAAVATELTGWTSEAEAAGLAVLDVRLSTADGAVDLSRPASANSDRLAVAGEVVEDPEIGAFWIGASRIDLILVAGADQSQARERWTQRVGELAPGMAVTIRAAEAGSDADSDADGAAAD